MLKKTQKLNRENFTTVFKQGKVCHSPHFSLRLISAQKNDNMRAAVVVSKKIEKQAVKRNQTRRRVYYALKKVLGSGNHGNYWMIIIVKKSIRDISSETIQKEIEQLLKKVA